MVLSVQDLRRRGQGEAFCLLAQVPHLSIESGDPYHNTPRPEDTGGVKDQGTWSLDLLFGPLGSPPPLGLL